MGASVTDEIALIPSGKLFLKRSPRSPKGELECLYNDAFVSVRKTTAPFFYQITVTRVYQEGELNANGTSGFDSDEDEDDHLPHSTQSLTDVTSAVNSKDEWNFPLLEDLHFHFYDKPDGHKALAWKDVNGDLGDEFEFVIEEDVKLSEIDGFTLSLYKSLYEQKYHKSSTNIHALSQLQEFTGHSKLTLFVDTSEEEEEEESATEDEHSVPSVYEYDSEIEFHDAVTENEIPSKFVKSTNDIDQPKGEVIYESKSFALHLFDPATETYELQIDTGNVELKLIKLDKFQYSLYIKSANDDIHFNASLTENMSPAFNSGLLSFVFNYFTVQDPGVKVYSWLVLFSSLKDLQEFQVKFMDALFESINKEPLLSKGSDKEYLLESFDKLALDDDEDEEEFEESEEEQQKDISTVIGKRLRGSSRRSKSIIDDDEFGDQDEEREKDRTWKSTKDRNSNLTVGTSKDRSYVVRGNKLGVFKLGKNTFDYSTTISNLKDLKGDRFNPKDLILHQEDQFLVMSNDSANDNSLYKMDLNRGKIIEQWSAGEKHPIVSFGPNSKFSQLTNEQTLTGISQNSLFRLDPRLSGSQLVEDDTLKAYKTKNNKFATFATTEQGYLAVGSLKGDIRLYDRLGLNAKTALPSYGEPNIHLDVTKDGRWLLATYATHLLLIDLKIGQGQKHEGSLGFNKAFDQDKKPKPRRLVLNPEHAAFIQVENGKPVTFTSAHFNTGANNKETSIVTTTGSYVITWSLRNVISNKSPSYMIRKYQDSVIAGNFKFGSNTDVIVALLDDVSMIKKSSLVAPNKILKRSK